MAMHHYCTLFDKNYLYKGLALHASLIAAKASFHLWILAMDDSSYELLSKMQLANVTLISLREFEDDDLKKIKSDRTPVEYCWTITPSLPLYLIKKDNIDEITYVDADLFFYSDPEPIFTEMGKSSILLIEHRYSPSQKKLEKFSGRFNVQFMTFKNDVNGVTALKWWRDRCIEWCYHRYEDGKLGDQLYLQDWPERFKGVHVLRHRGAGVAPWNVQVCSIIKINSDLFINKDRLIFYHFHAFKQFDANNFAYAPGYWIPSSAKKLIYAPYITAIQKLERAVKLIDIHWQWGFSKKDPILQRIGLYLVALKKYLIDKGVSFYHAESI